MLADWLTGQSDGDDSSTEDWSSQVTLVCGQLTKVASTLTIIFCGPGGRRWILKNVFVPSFTEKVAIRILYEMVESNSGPLALRISFTLSLPQPASVWIFSIFRLGWVLPTKLKELVISSEGEFSITYTVKGKYFSLCMTRLSSVFSRPQHF